MDHDGNTEKLHIAPTKHGKTAPCFSNVLAPSKNNFISWRTSRTLEIFISQSYSHVSAASFSLPFITFILLIQSGMAQAQALTWTERNVPAVHTHTERREREREPCDATHIIFYSILNLQHVTREFVISRWKQMVTCESYRVSFVMRLCVFFLLFSLEWLTRCAFLSHRAQKKDCVTFPTNNPNAPFVHPRDTQALWDLWPFGSAGPARACCLE
jgi:hypothetical protein